MVYNADGFQFNSNEKISYRHFSNTLYNIMRGGIYANGYLIDKKDFTEFVTTWNRSVASHEREFLEKLPDTIHYNDLVSFSHDQNYSNFERLIFYFLKLSFNVRYV